MVQRLRRWPDGAKLGRGHGQPYLQPTYAQAISNKSKTIEGRPGIGWAADVAINDWVTFKVSSSGGKKLVVRVTAVQRFRTFCEMLETCGVHNLLPGFAGDIEAGAALYRSFSTMSGSTYAELEASSGAIALHVLPLAGSMYP